MISQLYIITFIHKITGRHRVNIVMIVLSNSILPSNNFARYGFGVCIVPRVQRPPVNVGHGNFRHDVHLPAETVY